MSEIGLPGALRVHETSTNFAGTAPAPRPSMRHLVVASLLLTTASPAFANQCDLTSPRSAVGNVAAGCPLEVFVPTAARGTYEPSVAVRRGNDYVDLAKTIQVTTPTLDITTTTKDPDTCVESTSVAATGMTVFSVSIDGIAEGDWIRFDGGDIYVSAPAACVHPAPTFYCDAPYGACNGDQPADPAAPGNNPGDGGCSAGGSPGLLLGALLLFKRRRGHHDRRVTK